MSFARRSTPFSGTRRCCWMAWPAGSNARAARLRGSTRVSGRHLLGLVEEVLDIAKVEAGQNARGARTGQRDTCHHGGCDARAPASRELGCRRDASACTDVMSEVTGDERRVRQILLNLLANAVKFTRPGGRVTVACNRVEGPAPFAPMQLGSWMCLAVSDTGIGIDPEHLETISSRSYSWMRVTRGRAAARGSGSRSAAGSRGSWVATFSVSSRMGQGATFTLWLPAWDRDRPATTRSSTSSDVDRSIPRLPLTASRFAARSPRLALQASCSSRRPRTSWRRSSSASVATRRFHAHGR